MFIVHSLWIFFDFDHFACSQILVMAKVSEGSIDGGYNESILRFTSNRWIGAYVVIESLSLAKHYPISVNIIINRIHSFLK